MRPCTGGCKKPYTTHFVPQVLVTPMGWWFILHDVDRCEIVEETSMERLVRKAVELRKTREEH